MRGERYGFVLFGGTLFLELLVAGPARFILGYGLALAAGVFCDLPLSKVAVALVAVALPVCYSFSPLFRFAKSPLGRGRVWRWQIGARQPTDEEWSLIVAALARLTLAADEELPRFDCYVIDETEHPVHMSRGRVVVVARSLVLSDSLAAILAHELHHVVSWDGRLTEAANRFQLWDDPLREGTNAVAAEAGDPLAHRGGALTFGALRWLFRLVGGGDAMRLLRRLWAGHWRQREFAADAKAVVWGQGRPLLRYLVEKELPLDGPQPGARRYEFEHPNVAQRVARLSSSLGLPQ